jgi:hypothetical protein
MSKVNTYSQSRSRFYNEYHTKIAITKISPRVIDYKAHVANEMKRVATVFFMLFSKDTSFMYSNGFPVQTGLPQEMLEIVREFNSDVFWKLQEISSADKYVQTLLQKYGETPWAMKMITDMMKNQMRLFSVYRK